jgi:hypothetical protein
MLGSIVENRLITAALARAWRRRRGPVSVRAPDPARASSAVTAGQRLTLDGGERLRCTLLIAADGALSPTASTARLAHPGVGLRAPRDRHHGALSQPHRHTAWQRFLPTGPLALLPLPGPDDRLCSIVWSIDEEKRRPLLAMDDAAFAPLSATPARPPRRGDGLRRARAFPLRQRHAVDYVQPAWPWSPTRRTRFTPWRGRASTWVLRMWRCWPRRSRAHRARPATRAARCTAALPAPSQGRQPGDDGGHGRLQAPVRQRRAAPALAAQRGACGAWRPAAPEAAHHPPGHGAWGRCLLSLRRPPAARMTALIAGSARRRRRPCRAREIRT